MSEKCIYLIGENECAIESRLELDYPSECDREGTCLVAQTGLFENCDCYDTGEYIINKED